MISKNKISAFTKSLMRYDLLAFLLVISAAAFYMRWLNFPFESADYKYFLSIWYTDIDAAGGIAGIGNVYGNYTPAYMYLMAIMTHFPISGLFAIKLFSVIFDFIMAVFAGLCVLELTGKKTVALASYTAVLFLPSVFINSSIWAQCDSIFVCFLIMSLYFMLKGKSIPCMVFFGLAFSFKLQAIFFIPVLILASIKGKVKWWSFALAIGTFFAMGLPAVIAGMSFSDAYGVYFLQANYYSQINMNAPNLYSAILQLMTYVPYEGFADSLIWFTFGGVGCAMLLLYKSRFDKDDNFIWLLIAVFFAAFMPFLLPHMHERYWYLCDILALITVFCRPKYLPVSVSLLVPSLYSLSVFIFRTEKRFMPFFGLVMLVGICAVGYGLYQNVKKSEESTAEQNTI